MQLARQPRVVLVALTPEAREAIGGATIAANPMPYRVGREFRGLAASAQIFVREQRLLGAKPTNELYLREQWEQMNVSREHFQLEWTDGGLTLVDRGSTCGTIVEGETVGGDGSGGMARVNDGDVIIVGTAFSPFVFKVRVAFG
jgi:predicted component of type VI protein secretion system